MQDSAKCFAQVQADNVSYSAPSISAVALEGLQICQLLFPLCKAMLAVLSLSSVWNFGSIKIDLRLNIRNRCSRTPKYENMYTDSWVLSMSCSMLLETDRPEVITPLKREFVHSWMLIFKLWMGLCFAALGFISKETAETRKKVLPGFFFTVKMKSKHLACKSETPCLVVSVLWFS